MTSPVDTSVKHFNSTMANAPVLNAVAGSLVALLDALLRDGFDTKTLTSLVAAGGIMTATWASGSHSSQADAVVLIAGVSGGPSGFAGANGEQKVISRPTALTATWATALPDGTYTGTITMKMAPLGFTTPFTGTNLRAYKSSDPASTGMILRVDDTGTTSARVRGFEAMSDINTGAGPFPTDAQISGGGYWAKGLTASATALTWSVFGDSRMFIISIAVASAANAAFIGCWTRFFGDMLSLRPGGDAYACALNCSAAAAVGSQGDGVMGNNNSTASARTYSPRDHTGLGSAVVQFYSQYTGNSSLLSGSDSTLGPFPSVVDGGIKLSKNYINSSATPRADVPGAYHVPQSGLLDTLKNFDVVPGTLALAGRNLQVLNPANTTPSQNPTTSIVGAMLVDRTGPWR